MGKLINRARSALANAAAWVLETTIGDGVWLQKGNSLDLPPDAPMNWWQLEGNRSSSDRDFEIFAPAYSCVNIISQDLSRIPLEHLRIESDKSRSVVTTKAPSRIFRQPNRYQSRVDLILYLARSLLFRGNAYAIPTRNDRREVSELYPLHPDSCWPYIEPNSREIFYRIGNDPTSQLAGVENDLWYPQREVLHIRGQTPSHPLIGETPLVAAAYATSTGNSINRHTARFFDNMSRPSGILSHPGKLEEDAMKRIKQRWKELMTGRNLGEPAVLAEGMTWQNITLSAVDAELIKTYELSEKQLFQLYRVPPFLAGNLGDATLTNVETLTRFYLQSCLAFWENLIEAAFTIFFRLPIGEEIHFDTDSALLAGDLKERMEAYSRGIQNGVYAPNEARKREGLSPVEYGDAPRVQAQLVPLSFNAEESNSSASTEPVSSDPDGTRQEAISFVRGRLSRAA